MRIGMTILVACLTGCAGAASVRFDSENKATARLVDLNKAQSPGESAGNLPQTFPLSKLNGKAVRIEATDGVIQYWAFPDQNADLTVIRTKVIKGDGAAIAANGANTDINEWQSFSRLLMRAYSALGKNDGRTAREIADQLIKMQPRIAAPHIVKGVSFLLEDNKAAARASLNLAKGLDPKDTDIDRLLGSIK